MDLKCQMIIRNNPNLKKYLREHSYLYKDLNRNGDFLTYIEEEMKKAYKLTPEDRLVDIGNKINMVNEFIKILS